MQAGTKANQQVAHKLSAGVQHKRRLVLNARTRRALNTAALAAIFLFTAFGAHAEATFNLPVEVHWGLAILKPGKYTINVPLAQSWPQQMSLTRNGKVVASLMPSTESAGSESNESYLQLVSVAGTYYVGEYRSGPTGKQFTFLIPKGAVQMRNVEAKLSGRGAVGTPSD
jgi:hypothetical protein